MNNNNNNNNNKNPREFLDYIKKPLTYNNLNKLYLTNNIKFERCQLFNDFTQSLIIMITDTYMGDDITNLVEQKNHFDWCWNKNIENFEAEGIIFTNVVDLYYYFKEFMVETFYLLKNKDNIDEIKTNLQKLWDYILSYTVTKTRSDIDTFLDIYDIFEKSL